MTEPTPRQLETLRAIAHHQQQWGYPISIRELCVELGVTSTNGVSDLLKALERKGLIHRPEAVIARSIQLTQAGRSALEEGQHAGVK